MVFGSTLFRVFHSLYCGEVSAFKLRGGVSVARLAQLVERKTLNLVVVGSSPTVDILVFFLCLVVSMF